MLKSRMTRGLLLLFIGLLLSGCGQKGDLYLPEPEQELTSNIE